MSPPPFFPTYLAHCRRLMAGFSNREKGFFPPLFPFFGGQQRRPALCYSFSPSSSFPPFRWCKWHQSFQADGNSPHLIFAFASLNWQEQLFCIYMHSSRRFTTYVHGGLKYKKILQKKANPSPHTVPGEKERRSRMAARPMGPCRVREISSSPLLLLSSRRCAKVRGAGLDGRRRRRQ